MDGWIDRSAKRFKKHLNNMRMTYKIIIVLFWWAGLAGGRLGMALSHWGLDPVNMKTTRTSQSHWEYVVSATMSCSDTFLLRS